ncbi:MAG: Uma2 family endonuclease [Chloroflexi bacterium]|nr:Uma2 family endonuclease [Chloroflexota bacterium]
MSTTSTARQFTVDDLANFPDDGNRYEVIEGELYMSAAPGNRHQMVIVALTVALELWRRAGGGGLLVSGIGLVFSKADAVIPDLVWAAPDQLPAMLIDPATGQRDEKWHLAPALVIEVLSPGPVNLERDRETKLTLYSRRGVREYWIVDPVRRGVEVYRRTEGQLHLIGTVLADEPLTSPHLAGFSLPVADLFAEVEPEA